MYKVWKASIKEYRVLNTLTGEVQILERFTALNCALKVDINLYNIAKSNNFANSGNENDYFAWIECNEILKFNNEVATNNVFYNLFKSEFFKDRVSNKTVSNCQFIEINGNTLNYII